ncbi:hypothetical protein [Dysgonomonas sp. ZJ279]|uniref:hypothetical protein n=1 Tax=Dysgonomonas sp. ZJ279 TaxID=2709796 RepID=UPI0013EBE31D|nr:hypothetical protein [Dysgonomonas sp. ZJ279]
MAYNKRNLYLKVIEIQDIVRKGQKRGDSQKQIFYNEIEAEYFISIRTFYRYLEMPAHAELKKLDNNKAAKEAAQKAQMMLAF